MVINRNIVSSGFRPMYNEDVSQIVEIEESVYEFPWTDGIFRDCIRVGYNCLVYQVENEILAYGLITVAANEAHILNLCVAKACQGQGLGKKMLHRLLDIAEQEKADTVFLEVRASNTVAAELYQQEGFNRLGVRKDYYPAKEGKEDALVYGKAMNIPSDPA